MIEVPNTKPLKTVAKEEKKEEERETANKEEKEREENRRRKKTTATRNKIPIDRPLPHGLGGKKSLVARKPHS